MRKKEGEGEREGRKGTEEGPTKNSCRGAQNVKLRHCTIRFNVNNMAEKELCKTLQKPKNVLNTTRSLKLSTVTSLNV